MAWNRYVSWVTNPMTSPSDARLTADVVAVDLDRARVDVVEARDEVGRRRLAGARTARRAPRAGPAALERDPVEREARAQVRRAGRPPVRRRPRRAPRAGRPTRPRVARELGGVGRRPPRGRMPLRRPPPPAPVGRRLADARRRLVERIAVAPRRRRGLASTGRGGGPGSGTTRRGTTWPRTVAGSRATASGASTISGSSPRYSKIRSNRASAPWISTCTLSSWPSGKKSRLWSVVKATMSPIVGADGSPCMRQVAGQPVHERGGDAEDRPDDHEEPAPDHRLADLERGEAAVEVAEAVDRRGLLAERLGQQDPADAERLLGGGRHLGERLLGLGADRPGGPCRRGRSGT